MGPRFRKRVGLSLISFRIKSRKRPSSFTSIFNTNKEMITLKATCRKCLYTKLASRIFKLETRVVRKTIASWVSLTRFRDSFLTKRCQMTSSPTLPTCITWMSSYQTSREMFKSKLDPAWSKLWRSIVPNLRSDQSISAFLCRPMRLHWLR